MALAHAYQHACKWGELQSISQAIRASVMREEQKGDPVAPFSFIALPGTSAAEQLACARQYALYTYRSYAERRLPALTQTVKRREGKLRIGYCTADFKQHPVAFLMAEVFELHDRDRFEIHAYSYGIDDQSPIRKRIENAFDEFNDIRAYSIEDAARAIRADGIDILVDLTGYTEDGRTEIFAFKPAPIQVSYLGFLGTSGTDFMDYILADDFLVPAGQEAHYSERVKRLPSYQANDRQCTIAARPSRADLGLPEHGFVFCNFNQTYKILPDVFNTWLRLLRNTPDSVLWLYANNTQAILNLRNTAADVGIAHDRLIFAPMLPLDQHLARLQCADLFLDTLPYNAGTTASNALWAGLPVVTCAGETFSSRMAGSLLTAIGLPELITYDLQSYYQLALELANTPDKLVEIKNKLNRMKDSSLLFDSATFTHSLENAFREMYEDLWQPTTQRNTAAK
jgi:predicted O-linked N-acetylglucosamine transferase (SPINDLY family)